MIVLSFVVMARDLLGFGGIGEGSAGTGPSKGFRGSEEVEVKCLGLARPSFDRSTLKTLSTY